MHTMTAHTVLATAAFFAGVGGQAAAPAEKEAQLIAVLQSQAPFKDKADACRELARIGTRKAVPALAALLGARVQRTVVVAQVQDCELPGACRTQRQACGATGEGCRAGKASDLAEEGAAADASCHRDALHLSST